MPAIVLMLGRPFREQALPAVGLDHRLQVAVGAAAAQAVEADLHPAQKARDAAQPAVGGAG